MAVQMNITAEGLEKFRNAITPDGELVTLKEAKFYGGFSGGSPSGEVVATLGIKYVKPINTATNICRFICEDRSGAEYVAYSGEVVDADGVVVAIFHNEGEPLTAKYEKAEMLVGGEIRFDDNTNVSDVIHIGDTTFSFDSATETIEGVVELATEAEAKAGVDAKRAITPKTLDAVIKGHADVVHKSGAEIITGVKTFNNPIKMDSANAIIRSVSNSDLRMAGGTSVNNGGAIFLFGVDNTSSMAGAFRIRVTNGEMVLMLDGKPDGSLIWDDKNIVRLVNGTAADAAGNVVLLTFPNTVTIQKGDLVLTEGGVKKSGKTDALDICSGTSYEDSPTLSLYPVDYALDENLRGRFILRAGNNLYRLVGKPDGTLLWDGTAVQLSGTIKTSENKALVKTDTKGGVQICGGTSLEDGGAILGYGKDYESNAEFKGALRLQATNGAQTYDVVLFPNGRLRLGNGTRMNFHDNEDQHIFIDGNGDLLLGDTDGAFVRICGQESAINPSGIQLRVQDADGNKTYLIASPDGTLTWGGKKVMRENDFQVVDALPESPDANTFYFVKA